MHRYLPLNSVVILGFVLLGVSGCGLWPVMTEDNGRRPFALGKSDQALLPWAPHPLHLNENFGVAYRQSIEGQILHPRAAKNLDSIPGGIDPQATQFSLTRYHKMFEKPPFSPKKSSGGSLSGSSSGGGATK